MATDTLKKIGTGIYSGIDEFLFNLPDFVLSKVNNDAYKKFKEYRKGEGAKAEKIGDIASILGDIAMIPVAGAGLAKIGGKLGLTGAKAATTAAKTAKAAKTAATAANAAKTAGGVAKAPVSVIRAGYGALSTPGALGTLGRGATVGGLRSAADVSLRSVINPDEEEKDALRQNIGMAAGLGALGGGLAGGIGWARRVSKAQNGNMGKVSKRIADDLRTQNALESLKEKGIGPGYRNSVNKYMKNATDEYIKKDAVSLNNKVNEIWNKAAKDGLDVSELLTKERNKIARKYDTAFAKAGKNQDAIKKAVKESVVEGLTTGGKVDPNKLTGGGWKDVLQKVYATDPATKGKIDKIFKEASNQINEASTAQQLLRVGDYVEGQLRKTMPWLGPKEAGSISKGIRDSVFDSIKKNGGANLKKINKEYRHLATIGDAITTEVKKDLGKKYTNLADSFAGQIVSGNVVNNLIAGALLGGGALATGQDLKTAALATGAGVAGGTLLQAGARNLLSKGISGTTKAARAAAAEAIEKGLLDKAARFANSKTGNLLSKAATVSGTAKAKTGKEIPASLENLEEERRVMANELFDARLKEKRAQIDAYNRAFPDYAIDPQQAMQILESQRADWTSKEGTLARVGDKNLTKLSQAADLLTAGATGQEAYYALRQLGLTEKETKNALSRLQSFKSKTFRDNYIRRLLNEQAAKTLSPESYRMIEGGLV